MPTFTRAVDGVPVVVAVTDPTDVVNHRFGGWSEIPDPTVDPPQDPETDPAATLPPEAEPTVRRTRRTS